MFDREQGDPNTYDHLHKEFASLVDVLIESYCDDVGLTPRELVEALKSTDQSTKLSYRERVSSRFEVIFSKKYYIDPLGTRSSSPRFQRFCTNDDEKKH